MNSELLWPTDSRTAWKVWFNLGLSSSTKFLCLPLKYTVFHVFQLRTALARLSLKLQRRMTTQKKRLQLLYKSVSLTFFGKSLFIILWVFFCRRLCSEIHVFQLWSAVAQLSLRLHRHLTAQNKRLELLYKLVSLTFNVKHHIKRLEVFFRRNRYFLHSPYPATLASLSLKLWRHVLHPNKASNWQIVAHL